eukprot:TRINITY_DN1770_c0_g1_i1.p1 TRINITY_DN1770_c0_g1~~TRINITY_DN1770_c0_g1_i1.p1  ORF type:complete len:478 (+),score=116.70 TRINITY_DN1770_c0_g1_i1:22-1434(+)
MEYLLRGGPLMPSLSGATGIGEPGLRLLFGLLAGYPLAYVYRFFLLPSGSNTQKHLFSFLSGLWLAFFCFGWDCLHSLLSIVITWSILKFAPDRTTGLYVAYAGNAIHLLGSYAFFATENYDIDFTSAQCVLTLRLIGLAWDYYDGGRPESQLEHDQKLNGLKTLPDLLETLSWCYFFVGFLIGPQYPIRQYRQYYNLEFFKDEKGVRTIPDTVAPTLRPFLIGVGYLVFYNTLAGFFPSSIYTSKAFLEEFSFPKKLAYVWIVSKVAMSRYLGVWMLGEGSGTLSGMNFEGWQNGKPKGWRLLSNVDPWRFETTLDLQGIVESFNINTNDWVKRYVFKRLKFLNNRSASNLGALAFLAIWHGLYLGYILCFFTEYIEMEAERKIKRMMTPYVPSLQKMGVMPVMYGVAWLLRTFGVHYGLIAFEVKALWGSLAALTAVYWIAHVFVAIVYALDAFVFPPPRVPKTQKTQ